MARTRTLRNSTGRSAIIDWQAGGLAVRDTFPDLKALNVPASRIAFRLLQAFVWLMLLLVLLLFIVAPQISLLLVKGGHSAPTFGKAIDILEKCNGVVMHIFIYVYVAFFGSCLASFLNVVAWRVPRGKSILGSSHCPCCDHRLSMRDNIPVWGWLKNEGRCRHCRSPIAPRYLLVEVVLGLVFLILFVAEIVFGGFNLPSAPRLNHMGIEFVLFAPNAQLIQTFAFHTTLMSILFTIAMIATSSFRIPTSVTIFSVLTLVGIACFCPAVLQVSWTAFPQAPDNAGLVPFGFTSAMTMLLGAAAGITAGMLATASGDLLNPPPRTDPPQSTASIVRQQLIVSFAVTGLALGWQSVAVCFLIWCVLKLIGRLIPLGSTPDASLSNSFGPAVVMGSALLHILSWSLIYSR